MVARGAHAVHIPHVIFSVCAFSPLPCPTPPHDPPPMCGIALLLYGKPMQCPACAVPVPAAEERLAAVLGPRGPDHMATLPLESALPCTLMASVLHMRGASIVPQPLLHEDTGCVLLWNGEAYRGPGIGPADHDTARLLPLLAAADDPRQVLEAVEGPYAFIFWRPTTKTLWFGRDKLGRRSLVMRYAAAGDATQLIVSSVPCADGPDGGGVRGNTACDEEAAPPVDAAWQEVPVTGLFSVVLEEGGGGLSEHPWHCPLVSLHASKAADEPVDAAATDSPTAAVDAYLEALSEAVRARVQALPAGAPAGPAPSHADPDVPGPTGANVAVLFSGGIDSMLLAALAHRHVPPDDPIDLLNVAFGEFPSQTPDRIGSLNGLLELKAIAPDRVWNLVEIDLTAEEALEATPRVVQLIHPCNTVMDVNIATVLWTAAGAQGRVCLEPQHCATESRAVRYSSGVAGAGQSADPSVEGAGACTDPRPTDALESETVIPDAFQPLVEVLWAESATVSSVDEERVRLSLLGGTNCPLPWKAHGFKRMKAYIEAARDAGVVEMGPERDSMPWCRLAPAVRQHLQRTRPAAGPKAYKRVQSTARALLLGIGADETLAGYGRHRTTFLKGGTEALKAELEMDFGRLWQRNLGRDDRVIADRGKESRLPFLDERVLDVVRSLPFSHCCRLDQALGVGDKMLLRSVAREVGLTHSTGLQKRAIQFGTRIANRKLDGANKLGGTHRLDGLFNPRVCST